MSEVFISRVKMQGEMLFFLKNDESLLNVS